MKDLSLHVLDLIQNSIRAAALMATVELSKTATGQFTIVISDDGTGMDEEQLRQVKDPFFTTRETRKIGLGVPLLTQKAEQTGGSLTVLSAPGKGCEVSAVFDSSHPDFPPYGDFPGCAWMLMASNPEMKFVFRFRNEKDSWEWDSSLIHEALSGLPLTDAPVRIKILEWFQSDFNKFK